MNNVVEKKTFVADEDGMMEIGCMAKATLNNRQLRLLSGGFYRLFGWGSEKIISKAFKVSSRTIQRGKQELESKDYVLKREKPTKESQKEERLKEKKELEEAKKAMRERYEQKAENVNKENNIVENTAFTSAKPNPLEEVCTDDADSFSENVTATAVKLQTEKTVCPGIMTDSFETETTVVSKSETEGKVYPDSVTTLSENETTTAVKAETEKDVCPDGVVDSSDNDTTVGEKTENEEKIHPDSVTALSENETTAAVKPEISVQDTGKAEAHLVPDLDRVRRAGGGRKSFLEKNPDVLEFISEQLADYTYGDPQSTLKWSSLSQAKIASIINNNFPVTVSRYIGGQILTKLHYSRQKNQKFEQCGEPDPERDKQFLYIDSIVKDYLERGWNVISVDSKKKELLGLYAMPGTAYRLEKDPLLTLDHDFATSRLTPYGIYCQNNGHAWVSLSISSDTPEHAVDDIALWWKTEGQYISDDKKHLLILCDGGGSNSRLSYDWKCSLAKLSQDTGLNIQVAHYPAGASKYNKIEHRVFSQISQNWQGHPLLTIDHAKNYIASTKVNDINGVARNITCVINDKQYETGWSMNKKDFQEMCGVCVEYTNDTKRHLSYKITPHKEASGFYSRRINKRAAKNVKTD